MNLDVYQTLSTTGYRMDAIYTDIQKELITDSNIVDCVVDDKIIRGIKLLIGADSAVAPFTHPIIVHLNDKPVVVIDIRRVVRFKSSNIIDYEISNNLDYNLLVLRARVQAVGLFNVSTRLRDFDSLPVMIFSRWVANSVVFKLGLSPYDQNICIILAMAFYLSRFDEKPNLGSIALQIAKNTYIDPQLVTDVIGSEENNLASLDDLVDQLKIKINNIRIEKLSLALFLSSLTYGWRGNNAKEVMAISLEHPPTWIACLATAIRERSYKDSPIAKIAKTYTRNSKDKEFLMRLDQLLDTSEYEVY